MTPTFFRAMSAAAVLSISMAAFAQTTRQQPAEPQARTQTGTPAARQAAQRVTVVGCIQREADYRKTGKLGRGGTAGTGVGVGNEFVVIDARIASAGASPASGPATGTAGAAPQDYKLTGANEGKASQFVGKRVEISGALKPTEPASPEATRRPTTGAHPQIDVFAGEDLKLRELEVTAVRETAGTCLAK